MENHTIPTKLNNNWALGAVVSASRLHRVGRGFESLSAHHLSRGMETAKRRSLQVEHSRLVKSRKLTITAIAVILALTAALAWFFWPQNTDPHFRLKIVGQAVEAGKPMLLFKVELADRRRIQITDVVKVIGEKTEEPLESDPEHAWGLKPAAGFWGPSQRWPMGDSAIARKPFAVTVPTNAPSWRLRVSVSFENPNRWQRFKTKIEIWKMLRRNGSSLYAATRDSWRVFDRGGSQSLESDLITNQ